jgi:hypothetical protein
VQLGYGRAGWYSYDWIDNGGHRSADCIVPELQRLEVGDQILMLPGMGPRVRMIQPNQYLVAGEEAGVWCLALYSTMHGCRSPATRHPAGVQNSCPTSMSHDHAYRRVWRRFLRGASARLRRTSTLTNNPRSGRVGAPWCVSQVRLAVTWC